MKICRKCGAKYEGEQKFCKVCGQPLEELKVSKSIQKQGVTPKAKKGKKRIYMLIFALLIALLGGAGGAVKIMQDKRQEEQREEKLEEKKRKKEEKEAKVENTEEKEKEEKEAKEENTEEKEQEQEVEEAKKTEEAEQAELLKEYEKQEQADAVSQMYPVLADDEVEGEVLRIRGIFTECMENSNTYQKVAMKEGYNAWFENGQLKMINTTVETTTDSYERIFIYENEKLIFAYLKENGNESRLYYKDDNVFRWSYPETTQIQDNNFENPEFVQNGIAGRNLGYDLYKLALEQR